MSILSQDKKLTRTKRHICNMQPSDVIVALKRWFAIKRHFGKKENWTELKTLYSTERMESICSYLTDHSIPYKVRTALLPIPPTTVAPIGTMTQSMWYLSVHPDDAGKVQHYLRQEID